MSDANEKDLEATLAEDRTADELEAYANECDRCAREANEQGLPILAKDWEDVAAKARSHIAPKREAERRAAQDAQQNPDPAQQPEPRQQKPASTKSVAKRAPAKRSTKR